MNAPATLKELMPDVSSAQGTGIVHESARLHVTGEAVYTDDIPELRGTLYAALILSPVAHGELIGEGIDRAAILAEHGVVAVYTAVTFRVKTTAAPLSMTTRFWPLARSSFWAKPSPWLWHETCFTPVKRPKKPWSTSKNSLRF